MKIKTYTKKDIAREFSRRKNKSIRKSIDFADTFFDIIKDILIEENPLYQNRDKEFWCF